MATRDIEIKNILEEFENTFSCGSLKENKSLVRLMDDSLSVHMHDYLDNPTIGKHKFKKDELIEAIGNSDKYKYDPSNDSINLKYRPKRKAIVFRDIPKEHQKKDKLIELFDLSGEKKYAQKIKNIENLNGLFYVYFYDEETCLEIYRWIEKMKENDKDLLFYFTAFVKVENLKKEWLNMDNDDEDDFSGIILNPKDHKPRKLSFGEQESEIIERSTKLKHGFSKFNKFDPFLNQQKNTINQSGSILKNKFDHQMYSNVGNSYNFEKRPKAYSINYHNIPKRKSLHLPLNKDYPLKDEKSNLENIFILSYKVEHKYNTEEITKIFINMNFLKKLEMPDKLRQNFVKDLFNKNAKTHLDQFKNKYETRIRSNTLNNNFYSKNKFNHLENINFNSSHYHLSKFAPSEHHDEYNNLRHRRKHSLRS